MELSYRIKDMSGLRFGRLKVLKLERCFRKAAFWLCVCTCGTRKVIRGRSLRIGRTKSCGCGNIEAAIANCLSRSTHGMARRGSKRASEYRIWAGMIQRCTNPKSSIWAYYGGRGIKVCDRWMTSFEAFLKDVGRRPSLHHSIDRRNNDGHYEPGNVRWATKSQQMINRRPAVRKHS